MKDAECAEYAYFRFFRFLFFELLPFYNHFCTENCQFSMNFRDKSKNKKRKIDFPFVSAHSASFMKMGAELKSAYP